MFVGESVSEIVDKEKGSRMNFELEGDEAREAAVWKKLMFIEDKPGSIKELSSGTSKPAQQIVTIRSEKKVPAKKEKPTKPMIVEVVDDEDEDDDLVSYAKPDSDAEDSDEDATLVQRNKPKAPVYVQFAFLFSVFNPQNSQSTKQPLTLVLATFATSFQALTTLPTPPHILSPYKLHRL